MQENEIIEITFYQRLRDIETLPGSYATSNGFQLHEELFFARDKGRCNSCGKYSGHLRVIRHIRPPRMDRKNISLCKACAKKEKFGPMMKRYFPDLKRHRIWANLEDAYDHIVRTIPCYEGLQWDRGDIKDQSKEWDLSDREIEGLILKGLKEDGDVDELVRTRKQYFLERKARDLFGRTFRNICVRNYWIILEFVDEGAFQEMMAVYDKLVETSSDPKLWKKQKKRMKRIRAGLLEDKQERKKPCG